ncbi:hypothetical protein T9A_02212 [Alcanivorax jadensis T9]|uniref:Uncharacterized protein n=1 Tax=Alcanivorax jadensis T9 TaxID=1177181 RepID=A0ABR4WBD7_9GAMM|nr:hypothetical protein T9A_02212 [Alcanivorax jadensis T9]
MNPLKDLSQRYPRLAEILDQLSAAKGMDRHEHYVRACGFLEGLSAADVTTKSESSALNVCLCNVLFGLVVERA